MESYGKYEVSKKNDSAAKQSGADFAKFQTWSTKTLLSGPWDKDGRLQIYKKAELSRKQHIELIKYCKKVKISFLTSVFNHQDVEWLKKLNLKYIKVPSPEIHNIKLLKAVNGSFDYVIASTGTAT